MDIGSLLLGLALLGIVGFIVAQPILERRGLNARTITPTDRLIAERESVLNALRDLDFDHATGKLTTEDHAAQRGELVARGAAILKELDALSATETADTPEDALEAAIRARRTTAETSPPADPIEAAIAQRRRAPVAPTNGGHAKTSNVRTAGSRTCPKCGRAAQAADRFCAKCGTPLPTQEVV